MSLNAKVNDWWEGSTDSLMCEKVGMKGTYKRDVVFNN